jgi:putative beta-lysine N-acetyltransferase
MSGSSGGRMTPSDAIVQRGSSVLQHGHYNNRVYIMKLAPADTPDIIRYVDDLSRREGYTKIFVKVPESQVEIFVGDGYVSEATVPFFYHGEEPAVFMAKYLDAQRKEIHDVTVISDILSGAFLYTGERNPFVLPEGFSLMHAHHGDAGEIAALYRAVFRTYPFPISDPEFLCESMKGNVRYFIIRKSRQLAAAASCEIDAGNENIEVTDFATDPQFRGRGFANLLLHAIETEMKKEGIRLAYTIARALSRPINAAFAGAGYQYGGLLPNNTNICGHVESMNVWYKRL